MSNKLYFLPPIVITINMTSATLAKTQTRRKIKHQQKQQRQQQQKVEKKASCCYWFSFLCLPSPAFFQVVKKRERTDFFQGALFGFLSLLFMINRVVCTSVRVFWEANLQGSSVRSRLVVNGMIHAKFGFCKIALRFAATRADDGQVTDILSNLRNQTTDS